MSRRWIIVTSVLMGVSVLAAMLLAPNRGGPRFCEYKCTKDCSGHEAGYRWAQRKLISSKQQCGGKSQSFIEGCFVYVEGCQVP